MVNTCPHAQPYTPGTPGRTLYLAARGVNVFVCAIILIFVSIVAGKYDYVYWLNPSLAPSITSFLYSIAEITAVIGWNTRAHRVQRALYDGALAVGFAIAAGFLGSYAVPFVNCDEEEYKGNPDRERIAGLGVTILVCMLIEFIVYVGIAAEGVWQTAKGGCCCHLCDGEHAHTEHPTDKPVTPITV